METYGYGAVQDARADMVRRNWGWILVLGIASGILGIIALVFTAATTLVSAALLGVVVMVGGVVVIASAFSAGGVGGAILRGALGLLVVLAGLYLIFHPTIGALTLTLVMAWYFIIAGVLRIASALVERYTGWGWGVVAGAVTLLLGILLSASWPVSGLYAIGIFVGIDLILNGISWITAAFMARSYTPNQALPA